VEVVPTVKLFGGLRYTREKLSVDYNRQKWLIPDSAFDPIQAVPLLPPNSTLVITDANRSDGNLSGRLGIQWQPAPGLNYYASYNRGYKGAAANVGSSTANAAAAVISPETAEAYEIGAKQRFFEGRLAIDIALYRQKINNIQQTAVIPGSVSVSLINAGALKTKGFEINVTARPVAGLTLDGGLVYTDAEYAGGFRFSCGPSATRGVGACAADGTIALDGTQAIGSPKWKFVTSATYELPLADDLKLTTRIAYNWRSSIQRTLYHDPVTLEPSYGIADASIGIGSPDDHWQATFFVKNITNHLYYTYLDTSTSIAQAFGQLPRDFKRYAGIRLNYRY
jgi:iron complex outermembrane receptor protein